MDRIVKHVAQAGITLGVAAATFALGYWQLRGRFTEEPFYDVEGHVGPLEIRRYAPMVRAETQVAAGSWNQAMHLGFRRLARYIFGRNRGGQRIAMTAPVNQTVEPVEVAPPTPRMVATLGGVDADDRWTLSFTMPKGMSLDALPAPLDGDVELRPVGARRVAVLRFAGKYTPERVRQMAAQLRRAVLWAGLDAAGDVEFAGYDPPTTLPFLRRNEVWVELLA